MIERLNPAGPLKAYVEERQDSTTQKLHLITTTISEEQFARHITEHNCYMTKADILYAIRIITENLVAVLANGDAVKFEDLGIIKLTARDGRAHLSLLPDKKTAQLLKKLKIKVIPKVW